MMNLRVKCTTIKLFKGRIEKNLHALELGKTFLNSSQKA